MEEKGSYIPKHIRKNIKQTMINANRQKRLAKTFSEWCEKKNINIDDGSTYESLYSNVLYGESNGEDLLTHIDIDLYRQYCLRQP